MPDEQVLQPVSRPFTGANVVKQSRNRSALAIALYHVLRLCAAIVVEICDEAQVKVTHTNGRVLSIPSTLNRRQTPTGC